LDLLVGRELNNNLEGLVALKIAFIALHVPAVVCDARHSAKYHNQGVLWDILLLKLNIYLIFNAVKVHFKSP